MRKIKVGSGMTEHEVTQYDPNDPSDQAEMRKSNGAWREGLVDSGGHFAATTRSVLNRCALILEDVRRGRKSWDKIEDDSQEDFAWKVESGINAANYNLAQNEADQALSHAFIAGCQWGRAEMKWQWEPHALRGAGTIRSAAVGGNNRRGAFKPNTSAILAKMEQLRGSGQTKARAAELTCRSGLGVSKAANEKLWARHKGRWRDATES